MGSVQSVEVQIFGRTYRLMGSDRERTQEVARIVDEQMNHVADRIQDVDSYRVAVLTALNIADQLLAQRDELENYRSQVDARSTRMLKLLDSDRQAEEYESSVA